MGYELHITRADHWTDSASTPIRLEEWKAYVASDLEMRLDGFVEARSPVGETIRYENQGLAFWTPPGQPQAGTWFDWRDGRIVAKNPTPGEIVKMMAVADALRARVQGDGGEIYDESCRPASPTDIPAGSSLATRPNGCGWTMLVLTCALAFVFGYFLTTWAERTLGWGLLLRHLLWIPIVAISFGLYMLVGKTLEKCGLNLFRKVG